MKRILPAFLCLIIPMFSSAQLINSIGIKGGLAISNQSWNSKVSNLPSSSGGRAGLYFATTLEFLHSKYITLITDIGYSQKGIKKKVLFTTADLPEGLFSMYYDTKFKYLTLSPMLKARYEIRHCIPYALLGLRLDYQLSYEYNFYYDEIQDDFHKVIYGLTAGAGLEYKIKNIGICPEFQYQYDFNKVLDIPSSSDNAGLEVKNKAIMVSVGIKYYLHKKEEKK